MKNLNIYIKEALVKKHIQPGEYRCVDLGLSSKTLWADRNIGAKDIYDFGDYYAWGEIEPKDSYSLKNYKPLLQVGKRKLTDDADVAYIKTKGEYRIPTDQQLQELIDGTIRSNVQHEGKYYIKFASKVNDQYILIPLSGYKDLSRFYESPEHNTKIPSKVGSYNKHRNVNQQMFINLDNVAYMGTAFNESGLTIRAVKA